MPHLTSLGGLQLVVKYVGNWYSVLAVYFKIKSSTKARFKDGKEVPVSRTRYDDFQEEVFKRYLQDKGYSYSLREGNKIVYTPDGFQIMYSKVPYSFILDEVFEMKEYGVYDLKGRVVIDVGTYMAETCLYFVRQGAAKVYGFEIDVENYRIGLENIRLNNMADRVHIYNQPATYASIKNLIYAHVLKNVFLKIDCDGCEYEILENADPLTFKNVNDIVLEYHGRPKRLIERLTKLGYGTKRKRGLIFQPWGMVYATRELAAYCIT
jgi:Ribosomal protein L11 methyltransferase (PrmA)